MAHITRPKSISVVTIIAIVLILLAFPMLFMPSVKRMGDFVPMILGIIITLQFVSLIGVWHMKQWGVQLFIVMFCTRVITFMFLDLYGFRFYFSIFYSVLFIIFFLIHYRKMDGNL
jgi:hypothetical protein